MSDTSVKFNEDISIINVEQKSQEWLDMRKKYISASSVATALGFNGDSKYTEYINEKRSGVSKFTGNTYTHYGELFEDIARQIFEYYTDSKVHEIGFIVNKKYPCLGISPDGVVEYSNTQDLELLEIKCPSARYIDGNIKNDYYHQIQMQLAVTELDICNFLECKFELVKYDTKSFETSCLTHDEPTGVLKLTGDIRKNGKEDWDRVNIEYGPMYCPQSLNTIQGIVNKKISLDSDKNKSMNFDNFVTKVNDFISDSDSFWVYKLVRCSLQQVSRDKSWVSCYSRLENVYGEFNEEPCSDNVEPNSLLFG